MGSIYAQLVILSMKNYNSIPKSLQKHADSDGYNYNIQLKGEQAIAAEIDTIAWLVKCSKIKCVYVSPFENDLVSTDQHQLFRSLYERFPSGWDRNGYGVAVLDAYHNAMLYCDLYSEKIKTVPSGVTRPIEEEGWCTFYTEKAASDFVVDFIRNGIKKDGCLEAQPIDPDLFQWICSAWGQNIKDPADLERITELKAENFSKGTPAFPHWLCPVYGDWRAIGNLPRLEKLEFPHVCIDNFSFLLRCKTLKYLDLSKTNFYEGEYLEFLENLKTLILPPAEITDFSFLKKCRHLAFLDVSKTNFADCSLLLELTELETVILPVKKNLLHYDAIENLAASIRTEEPEVEKDNPPALYLSKKKLPSGENGFYAQIVVADSIVYREKHISKEMVQDLIKLIKAGKVKTLTISADIDMESIIFTADIKDGWAALTLHDFEYDVYYLPENERYRNSTELAPPKIGGQSPVTMSEALDDLRIASECVRHYIKYGKLSPKVKWIQTD